MSEATKTQTSQIAATIKNQIGRGAFTMMGAFNLLDHGNGLSFKFKGSRLFNYIKITLDVSDLYTVTFMKLSSKYFEVKKEENFESVEASTLHRLIENMTGLYLSL